MTIKQSIITGTVSDAHGGLPGVTVSVKNKPVSTITNENGQFSIAAEVGDVLVFSYIGYAAVTVTVDSRRVYDVIMQEDATTLKEVTVNAGYYTVKDKELTGSISKITSKELEKQPVTNVLAAMQGRMAGVDIIQDGGTAGGGFQIKIRGVNSLRADGNSPLYIIDGVPYSSESIGYASINSGMASPTSPLNSINPSDIESIEVLKDADATAIYGSRGANGVVLLTTKKGKVGRTKITVNATSGTGKATRFIDLMHTEQYLAMRKDGFAKDNITTYPASAYDVNGTWDQNRYTDWQKELLGGTAEFKNLNVSVSGGSAQTQYLLSGTTNTETAVIPGDFRYRKAAGHFSMNHAGEDNRFKLALSGGYTKQFNKQSTTDLTRLARNLAPNAPALYTADGELNWENNTFSNPLALLRGYSTVKTNDLIANVTLNYALTPKWEIKANMGYTNLDNHEQRLQPSSINNPSLNISSSSSLLYENVTTRESTIIEPQIRWADSFGKGKLDILVGGTAQKQTTGRLYTLGQGFASNSLITNMASANNKFVLASDVTEYKYQAFFGRVNYNYNDKYIVNLTGRRDGSSRFGPGKQFAYFGAAGAAWVFTNETSLKNSSWLSFGKLRASYGTTGNDQIGDYQYLNTYASSGQAYQGITGLEPTRLFNPEFGWEKSTKLEVALETGFLSDRIVLTTAFYRNRSSNQLVGVPLSGTTGFSSINANLDATVQNQGLEITVHTDNLRGKNLRWSTNVTIATARNKLISFPGLETSTYANTYVVGEPITIVKLYQYKGVNAQTGLFEFADLNGDGIINAAGDKHYVADLTPKYFGGFQNQLKYKNWDLDFLFQFVKQQTYNYTPGSANGTFFNQSTDYANVWQQSGDMAAYQMNTSGANSAAVTAFSRYTASDAIIVDGSYIRLKNIALTYTVPLKYKTMNCKLTVQGQNVLTFTNYKGGDPEFRATGFLPPLRVITGGVQLSF
ncbi:SusC/RagA family TonB-linked outer membrane protein [Flavobacterium silvisoli]|uniref:SusC/RagA family TonB-linked outer membrane protein n=2 Tax=Flavobacterium silvisoli TaxID=2529433 RepID=A0A4Q9YZK2_9FLAO|nr:SusC/RagA family TonB-linked outer membrane protein [Flavobacterium silvisoli]